MTRKFSILACSLTLAAAASAQSLDTEITVNHTIVPEERAAGRLRLLPSLQLPQVSTGKLSPATSANPSPFVPTVLTLEPVGYASSLTRSPYKGYATLGYFPLYNLDASAGYRFIDTDSLTLGAMMQFNGTSYDSSLATPEHLHRNNLLVGVGAAYSPDAASTLKAALSYRFSNLNNPIVENVDTTVNSHMLNLGLQWTSSINSVDYHVGASYGLAAFSGSAPGLLTEHRATFDAGLTWHYNTPSAWSLDLGWQVASARASNVKGLFTVEPRYDYTGRRFQARVGIRGDFYTGSGRHLTRYSGLLSPDLRLQWTPGDHFALYGSFNGSATVNSLADLYAEMPYLLPNLDYTYSRVYDAEVGLTLGPWRGGSVTAVVARSFFDDWLTPVGGTELGYLAQHSPAASRLGVKIDYSYRTYLTFNAALQWVLTDEGSYCRWRDNAKIDFEIGATIRPISRLQIILNYHARTDRFIPSYGPYDDDLLGISDLNAGVHFDINDQWGVFANCNNILNHKYYITQRILSQGVNALVGATYKF
jgi:hypothetical protein